MSQTELAVLNLLQAQLRTPGITRVTRAVLVGLMRDIQAGKHLGRR